MTHPLPFPARCTAFAAGLVFSGLTALAAPALAQDISVGLAVGPDRGRVDCVAPFACDRSDLHWKLSAAYGFGGGFDAQLAYFNAGRFDGGDTTPLGTPFGGSFRVDGVALTAGYRWDLTPDWRLAGRLGAASVRTRFEYTDALAADVSKTTLQPYAGVGLSYAVTPALRVGLDLDVTRFKVYTSRGSLRMLGLAAQFSF